MKNVGFEPWPDRQIQNIDFFGKIYLAGDCVFQANNLRFGFEICQDAWEETRFETHLSELQLDIIFNPSASHFALGKQNLRRQLIIDGAASFQCHYLYANLNGNEAGRVIYDGAVFFSSPDEMIYESDRLHLEDFRVHTFSQEILPKEKYISSQCIIHFSHLFNQSQIRNFDNFLPPMK